jgi:platelet-activating factor acetylhydrolase IB subunit alpha
VWDPNTGFGTLTIKGQAGWIRDVVCSSDGSMLASCSNDHSIVVWKMPSGNKLCNLDDHDHVVETVSFSIPAFDVSMKVSRAEIEGKTIVDTGRNVGKSTGGKYLVSGSRDKTVKVWEISSSTCLFTFTGHDNWVRGVAFHPYGQFIFSVSDDRSVRVWYVAVSEMSLYLFVLSLTHTLCTNTGTSRKENVSRSWQMLTNTLFNVLLYIRHHLFL